MALLELDKLRKDINTLFGYVRCLMAKSDETSPLVATEWSNNHSTSLGNAYTAGCYVYYNGHVYKCKFNNDGIIPTNTTYWLDLGEGHLLAEEQPDWNATGGRKYIVNKPTKTSDFTNDGEDGSSPYVTQDELAEALPDLQNLDEVLAQGDSAPTKNVNVKEVGIFDEVYPEGYSSFSSSNLVVFLKNKLGKTILSVKEGYLSLSKGPFRFYINIPSLDSNKTATFQNKSGVIAYTEDIKSYGLYSQIENSNSITGTTLGTLIGTGVGTLSVPENTFKVGDSFHLRMSGKITNANSQQVVIQLKSGSVVLASTGTLSLPTTTDKNWELTAEFTIKAIGTAGIATLQTNGKFIYNKNSSNAFEGIIFDYTENTNFNTTTLNTLNIVAQWLTSNTSNSINSHQLTLTKTY